MWDTGVPYNDGYLICSGGTMTSLVWKYRLLDVFSSSYELRFIFLSVVLVLTSNYALSVYSVTVAPDHATVRRNPPDEDWPVAEKYA